MGRSGLEQNLLPGMKVGLFGGSFNPAHLGHLHLGTTAQKALGLDRVLWLVTPGNPLKDPKSWQNYAQRVQSAKAMTARSPAQQVCEFEKIHGTRYSADTIFAMMRRWPMVRFVWLMGTDNLQTFHLWRDWQAIANALPIAVMARPGKPVRAQLSRFAVQYAKARLPDRAGLILAGRRAPAWIYLRAPEHFANSTALRDLGL